MSVQRAIFSKNQSLPPYSKTHLLSPTYFSINWYNMYLRASAAAAKSLQSCPTLCNPIDSSHPGSPIPEILQARALEWVATSFSNAWKWKVKVESLSCFRPSAIPCTAAFQAPSHMGFSGKSTGVGCHCLLRYSLYHTVKFLQPNSIHLDVPTDYHRQWE